MCNKIEEYLDVNLKEKLSTYNVSNDIVRNIISDVKDRLYSILYRWNDGNFRKTILVLGNEEAINYLPKRNIEIRSLVVIAIRNSLIEELSCDKNSFGISGQVIKDEDIPLITGDAINYFSQINLSEISKSIELTDNDVFGNLQNDFPATWQALFNLSDFSKLCVSYNPVKATELNLDAIRVIDLKNSKRFSVVMSGINPSFGDEEINILSLIKKGNINAFITDSLKSVTRNPNKLFQLIEFVLSCNAVFVTTNYYIENGYVEKRNGFLKPGHTIDEMKQNYYNYKGLEKKHRMTLKTQRKQI